MVAEGSGSSARKRTRAPNSPHIEVPLDDGVGLIRTILNRSIWLIPRIPCAVEHQPVCVLHIRRQTGARTICRERVHLQEICRGGKLGHQVIEVGVIEICAAGDRPDRRKAVPRAWRARLDLSSSIRDVSAVLSSEWNERPSRRKGRAGRGVKSRRKGFSRHHA